MEWCSVKKWHRNSFTLPLPFTLPELQQELGSFIALTEAKTVYERVCLSICPSAPKFIPKTNTRNLTRCGTGLHNTLHKNVHLGPYRSHTHEVDNEVLSVVSEIAHCTTNCYIIKNIEIIKV
jgi:hypothetical protein